MIMSNHLFSNLDFYHKTYYLKALLCCNLDFYNVNILFKSSTLLLDNRFHIWFAKWNTTTFSLTLWLIPFSLCWVCPPQELSLHPPWPAWLSSCSLFLLFQRSVSNGYIFLWTTSLPSTLLLLCIHSKFSTNCPVISVTNLHPSG